MSCVIEIRTGGGVREERIAVGRHVVGSRSGCGVLIEAPGVQAQHAMLLVAPDGSIELKSLGGSILQNGEPVHRVLGACGTSVRLGDAEVVFRGSESAVAEPGVARRNAAPTPLARSAAPPETPPKGSLATPVNASRSAFQGKGVFEGLTEVRIVDLLAARDAIMPVVEEKLGRMRVSPSDPNERAAEVRSAIQAVVRDRADGKKDVSSLAQLIENEVLGLGVIEPLLADEAITEIMVNRENLIFVESAGKLIRTPLRYRSREHLRTVIERIVSPLNKRIDDASPRVDARLADGSRVNAIIPPLAVDGPCLTIRKFRKSFGVQDLQRVGAVSDAMVTFLRACVTYRRNVIVSGGTGSGKTTLLNALASFIPNEERIVTIEDTAELQLAQEHVVRLESRPPTIEGTGAVPIRDLVINALRMRPDRIVVGECRSGEALDMMQAMNTGHDGSLTTLHANTPRDALRRLEVMCLMAENAPPHDAIREQIVSAIHLIVQVQRFGRDGSRRVTRITELTGMQGNVPTLQDIFCFKQTGFSNKTGRIQGQHEATGVVPACLEEWRDAGIEVDREIFRNLGGVA